MKKPVVDDRGYYVCEHGTAVFVSRTGMRRRLPNVLTPPQLRRHELPPDFANLSLARVLHGFAIKERPSGRALVKIFGRTYALSGSLYSGWVYEKHARLDADAVMRISEWILYDNQTSRRIGDAIVDVSYWRPV